jgi:3',5'-cyclic AMP phosphodiesterase CpdA
MLLGKAFLPWAWNYLKVALLSRHRFASYAASPAGQTGRPGVFVMPESCSVVLCSDWGSGTVNAYRVRDAIRALDPDITVHLGDVYFSGTPDEFRDYFLGCEDWPRGKLVPGAPGEARGTYLLNGNHEMYSGGAGYFDVALGSVGQEASYFAIENRHWRVVALDTGYYAKTFPLLELLPCFIRLHEANRRWLEEVVFSDPADRRPVILLSHHNWFSAFDTEYKRLGRQLLPYLDRVHLWFWGHEHRLAGYAPFGLNGGRVRARCIGHGGMPIEVGAKVKRRDRPLVFSDERRAGQVDDVSIGFCGFARLGFDGPDLVVEYIDENREKLLEERWSASTGGVKGAVSMQLQLQTYGLPIEALVD